MYFKLHVGKLCPHSSIGKIFLVMRLIIFLLTVSFLQLSAKSYSQNINYKANKVSLEAVLKEVEKQSGYNLFYKYDELLTVKPISIELNNVPLKIALDRVFQGREFNYIIERGTIIVTKKKNILDPFQNKSLYNKIVDREIKGTVRDKNLNKPLVGATVRIKGTKVATITDANGAFLIKDVSDESILIFLFTGYKSFEIKVGKNEHLNIFLEEDLANLNEVVITGYQNFQRFSAPGAISSVKLEDLTQLGSISVDQMLEGKIAGMAVTSVIGNPGAPPKIRVRGTSSITGDQEPIWVVDGVIWEEPVPIRNRDLATADELSLFNMVGGSIAGLNPNDIQSIDVLKDASATAIYGVKAVNGVIVVTTKKGKEGAARINYSSNVQVRERPSYANFNLMNAAERIKTAEEIYRAGSIYPIFPGKTSYEGLLLQFIRKEITQEQFDQNVENLANTNTDWFNILFRNSVSQNHTLSLSGGSNKTSYFFSGGFYDEQSNAKGSGLNRYNANMRLVNKFNDNFEADIKINLGLRKNKGSHSSINPYDYAVKTSRALPAFQENNELFFYEMGTQILVDGINHFHKYNIINELEQTHNQSIAKEMSGVLNLHWKITPWLSWNGTASYNTTQTLSEQWATEHSYNVSNGSDAYGNKQRGYPYGLYQIGSANYDRSKLPMGGTLLNENMSASNYTIRNQFLGQKVFKDNHKVQLILGQETRSSGYLGDKELVYGFFPDRGKMVIPPTTTGYKDFLSSFKPIRFTDKNSNYLSLFSIANYNYKDKYIFNGSMRYDGSNVFGKDATYRFLPVWSVAGKWIASEESFFKKLNFISFMAFRASYGLQGNIRSDASPSLVINVNNLDPETGKYKASIASLPNPGLRWEKTASYNFGYELSLFNKLNLTFDYYFKEGKNLIIDKAVSTVSGRNNILLNAGNMQNQGVELTLSAFPIKNQNFSWSSTLIAAQNRNKITRADVSIDGISSKEERLAKLTGKSVIEGDAYGTLYAYKFAGLNDKGWPTFHIQDGTKGFMSSESNIVMEPIGSAEPMVNGGWDNTFRYKNFSLGISLTYSLGGYKRLHDYYADESSSSGLPGHYENYPREFGNRWRNPGDERFTNVPVLLDFIQMVMAGGPHSTPTENGFDYSRNSSSGIHMHELYNKSDLRVVKADYVRLRAINLFYNLPRTILKKSPINQATISLSVQNLGFWAPDKHRFHGQDPELLGNQYATPIPTLVNIGINASF